MRDADDKPLMIGDDVVSANPEDPLSGTIVSELPDGRAQVLLGETDPATLLEDPVADEAADLAALRARGPAAALGPGAIRVPNIRIIAARALRRCEPLR